jgi:hypothetical protein
MERLMRKIHRRHRNCCSDLLQLWLGRLQPFLHPVVKLGFDACVTNKSDLLSGSDRLEKPSPPLQHLIPDELRTRAKLGTNRNCHF